MNEPPPFFSLFLCFLYLLQDSISCRSIDLVSNWQLRKRLIDFQLNYKKMFEKIKFYYQKPKKQFRIRLKRGFALEIQTKKPKSHIWTVVQRTETGMRQTLVFGITLQLLSLTFFYQFDDFSRWFIVFFSGIKIILRLSNS